MGKTLLERKAPDPDILALEIRGFTSNEAMGLARVLDSSPEANGIEVSERFINYMLFYRRYFAEHDVEHQD